MVFDKVALISRLVPLFVKIVEDGMAQDLMYTEYPRDTMEMLLMYANTVFDDSIQYEEEEKQRKVLAFISNSEILLHMEKGSMLEAMVPMFYRR